MAPASWVPAALVVALPSTCADEPPGTTPVRFLDEVAWFEELAIGRPELMSQHDGGIDDPARQAVVIRPEYRAELIADPNATYRTILLREYSLAERTADARLCARHQSRVFRQRPAARRPRRRRHQTHGRPGLAPFPAEG